MVIFPISSPHGFELAGRYWPTVEHYFQAQKFPGMEYAEVIRRAKDPKKAKSLGRSRDWPLRADWEAVKLDIMRRAVRWIFPRLTPIYGLNCWRQAMKN